MNDGSKVAKRNGNVGPYMYTRGDHTRADRYRLVLYGAYNAHGLIGSEYNGIAVLDDNRRQVWCDNIGRQPSGWYTPEAEAPAVLVKLFEKMKAMTTDELISFVNSQKHCRYKVEQA